MSNLSKWIATLFLGIKIENENQKKNFKILRSDFNEMIKKWDKPLRTQSTLKKKSFWVSI
jgi:hypothetical protein